MKRADVDKYEKLVGQLESTYEEMLLLSKKSPNNAINKFKLKFINNLLDQANKFLGQKYKPFNDFDLFNEEDVPQNSDVTFILSQYLQCFEKIRADNVIDQYGSWYWAIDPEKGEESDENGFVYIPTVKPKRLRW